MTIAKPTVAAAIESWQALPAELRSSPQGVIAGADKMPLNVDGTAASSTDPSTWSDFETASRVAAERGMLPGYVLDKSDPFTCIDLDVKDSTTAEQVQRFVSI